MPQRDSVDKIKGYLESASRTTLVLSRLFFRTYACPTGCGGCCPRFSLDYFPGERLEKLKQKYPHQFSRLKPRTVNGFTILSDMQDDNDTRWCRNLDLSTGRCKIHEANPFSCEFELNKMSTLNSKGMLIKRLFGRGWNFLRIDGKRGALCYMTPFSFEKLLSDLKLLRELVFIGKCLGYRTKIPYVIQYVERNFIYFSKNLIPKKNISFKGDNQ